MEKDFIRRILLTFLFLKCNRWFFVLFVNTEDRNASQRFQNGIHVLSKFEAFPRKTMKRHRNGDCTSHGRSIILNKRKFIPTEVSKFQTAYRLIKFGGGNTET